jgi:hypothetical protein
MFGISDQIMVDSESADAVRQIDDIPLPDNSVGR